MKIHKCVNCTYRRMGFMKLCKEGHYQLADETYCSKWKEIKWWQKLLLYDEWDK